MTPGGARHAAAWAALALAPAAAMADVAPAPQLVFDEGCRGVDVAQIRRITAVELRARRPPDGSADVARVLIACAGSAATIRAEAAGGARERSVSLAGTAAIARARLLALAITELVLEPELPADPPPPPVVGPAPPATVAVTAPRAPRALAAVGYGRAWGSDWVSAGAGVAASGWFARHALLRLDAVYDHGTARVADGTAVADTVSAGAAVLVGARPGGWQLAAGAGARLGVARLAGRPDDARAARGKAFLAPTGGPMVLLLVAPPPLGRVALQLSLEGGHVTIPVDGRAGDVRAFAVEGSWLGVSIGAGLAL